MKIFEKDRKKYKRKCRRERNNGIDKENKREIEIKKTERER